MKQLIMKLKNFLFELVIFSFLFRNMKSDVQLNRYNLGNLCKCNTFEVIEINLDHLDSILFKYKNVQVRIQTFS